MSVRAQTNFSGLVALITCRKRYCPRSMNVCTIVPKVDKEVMLSLYLSHSECPEFVQTTGPAPQKPAVNKPLRAGYGDLAPGSNGRHLPNQQQRALLH